MISRNRRARSVFSLEPLEGRSAPSHVGLLAHALVHVNAHRVQPAAQVEKLNDHKGQEKAHPAESKSAVDTSQDSSTNPTGAKDDSPESRGKDKSSPDPGGTR